MQRRVYFDNASTTAVNPEVLKTYKALLDKYYVNSESLYEEGAEVHRNIEKARAATAGLLGVKADEIIFTAGGSESNSLAIKGVAFANLNKKHIITTKIEHSSVMNSCKQLERLFGYDITWLDVNEKGVVNVEDVKKALREDTVLVSIMAVNNEVGSINPIDEIKEIVRKQSHAYFHVDYTQAIGKVPFDFTDIDLATISAHKLEGLKGSAILMKKKYVEIEPIISGGEQEYGVRGGTNNACTNMVFAKTLRLALEDSVSHLNYIQSLKDKLVEGLNSIEGIEINSPDNGIACTVNFSYEEIPSEVMQNALNGYGYMVSARSTCESHSNNPSYVLQAMGYSDRRASSCIRVSLSKQNTLDEVNGFIQAIKEITSRYGKL